MVNQTFETETHIKDCKAVKKVTTSDDEDSYLETKSSYFFYDSYETSPFNDIDLGDETFVHEPTPITEEQYKDFIAGLKDNPPTL